MPKISLATEINIFITEIMYDPEGADAGHSDWIEIYNNSDNKIKIEKEEFGIIDEEKIELGSDGIHYKNCHKIDDDFVLGPEEYAVIASNKSDFKKDYPKYENILLDSAFSFSSSGDFLKLSSDKCQTFFAEIHYNDSWGGKNNGRTLEKIKLDGDYSEDNWQESYVKDGTPGEKNSEKPKPKEYPGKIRINEILPNPKDDEEENEYIELYNYSDENIDLENWEMRDSSKSGRYVFPKGIILEKNKYLIIYRKDFKFALNNSEETVYLIDPNGKEIYKTNYAKSAKEGLSYNFDGKSWRWSKNLTPRKENQLNNVPVKKLKIEKKIYKNMLAEFRVSVKDIDGDEIKYTWDFGDGHKSYKQKTSHKYLKKGSYQASLKIFDGSEELVETFEIEVGKFPKSELKIVGLKANPKGKDTKLETIKIKNTSKKKINLEGWSVATGWKELYNHPINKKFILKPGETKELTRKYSAFTLNNKQTKLELRRPDGSIASKIKYSKKEGIQDDEIYEKGENGWEWVGGEETEISSNAENNAIEENENNIQESEETEDEEIDEIQHDTENLVQEDDNEENKEVLGAETVKLTENYNNKSNNGSLFQRMLSNANQLINGFINLFF